MWNTNDVNSTQNTQAKTHLPRTALGKITPTTPRSLGEKSVIRRSPGVSAKDAQQVAISSLDLDEIRAEIARVRLGLEALKAAQQKQRIFSDDGWSAVLK